MGERLGWRDETISRWHRKIGPCYATDLDTIVMEQDGPIDDGFRLLEYDISSGDDIPVALIDWKHVNCHVATELQKRNVTAQATFATRANVPSFVITYTRPVSSFRIFPTNEIAKAKVPHGITLNEQNMVRFLYWLRGKKAPIDVLKRINNG